MSIRVILVDDHDAVREGLKSILHKYGIEAVGEANCLEDAIKEITDKPADVVILDLNLGDDDGITNIESIKELPSSPPIVIYSMRDNTTTINTCYSAGAKSFISKGKEVRELAKAVKNVSDTGEAYYPPYFDSKFINESKAPLDRSTIKDLLSKREYQIFNLLLNGKNTREIADLFDVTQGTIRNHITAIKKSLHIDDITELLKYAPNNTNV